MKYAIAFAVSALLALVSSMSPVSTVPVGMNEDSAADPQRGSVAISPRSEDEPTTPEMRMWREVSALLEELNRLRSELAQARLEAAEAQRELEELRQFIEDHDEYGQDFEQYRAVRQIAEREQRRRATEEARDRYEAERAERIARMEEIRAQRDRQRAEAQRLRQYRDAGFIGLGLDVYISRVSYHYPTRDFTARLRFDPLVGWHQRYHRTDEMDFSQLTISGAVVNAARETRNVGVAIAFFDERGVQVGQETVHINNARPDVPYPFTSTVTMALARPFSSSTSYVLYADSIDPDEYEQE